MATELVVDQKLDADVGERPTRALGHPDGAEHAARALLEALKRFGDMKRAIRFVMQPDPGGELGVLRPR